MSQPSLTVRGYAWGELTAARTSLRGQVFSSAEAHALGVVHELAPAGELLDRAVAIAEQTPEDCLEQYAFTKRACQAAAGCVSVKRPHRGGGKWPHPRL